MNSDFEQTFTPVSVPLFITPTEYAKSIRLSPSTVYRHLNNNTIPAIQTGGKNGHWRIPVTALVPPLPLKPKVVRGGTGEPDNTNSDNNKSNHSRPSGAKPNWMRHPR